MTKLKIIVLILSLLTICKEEKSARQKNHFIFFQTPVKVADLWQILKYQTI